MTIENRYSLADKGLHHLAFLTQQPQLALTELEERLYPDVLQATPLNAPIFITALPRAGTTLLLDILVRHADLGSHTYRDMPFVMLPVLWHKLSQGFRVTETPRLRAHNDGMMVSVDSPEAFEEITWKLFWPEKYEKNRIIPWSTDENVEFSTFFSRHMRKIAWLRSRGDKRQARYISKNNLNVSRISYIRRTFPDSIVVVPFRHPLEHAASLLRQHQNFLDIHARDAFARTYMKDLGHFDFGENLRPVDFNGWLQRSGSYDTRQPMFWVEYWIAAYEHLLAELGEGVHALPYEAFCTNGCESFFRLGEILGIEIDTILSEQCKRLRKPRRHSTDRGNIDAGRLEYAESIYRRLQLESCLQ